MPANEQPPRRPHRPPQRREQVLAGKLGVNFVTPPRRRPPSKFAKPVVMMGQERKFRAAASRLDELLDRRTKSTKAPDDVSETPAPTNDHFTLSTPLKVDANDPDTSHRDLDDQWEDVNDPNAKYSDPLPPPPKIIRLERGVPVDAVKTHDRWTVLIPSLIEPFIRYSNTAANLPIKRFSPADFTPECTQSDCIWKTVEILVLYWDTYETISVNSCACQSLPQVLVLHGLFPASPAEPRVAFATDVLDFYRALFEKANDAVQAFASALKMFHNRRGFIMLDSKGHPFRDPFRRGLASSLRWFDALREQITLRVQNALRSAHIAIRSTIDTVECDWDLQQRCPACFGGRKFGRPFEEGGDIHVCVDGNFHHRHRRSAGDTPSSYRPRVFIPRSDVLAAEERINRARRTCRPRMETPPALDAAVDECKSAYVAADGKKAKTNAELFDDTGLMALVCRHDVPLFFANIDSPGEQQKYAVALLYHLFSLLPSNTTVTALYDVGCVLAKSCNNYEYFTDSIATRLQFATSAMHAYGHQWVCQIVYSPRMMRGMGLTDGEGVERLWSRLRKLIGLTRLSARSNRIRLLDRQATSLQRELRDDLGLWVRRRLRHLDRTEHVAQDDINKSGVDVAILASQWEDQRRTQMSLRQHAPSKLKRELDTVLDLQDDIDTIAQSITSTCRTVTAGFTSPEVATSLEGLERVYNELQAKIKDLYTSLNVHEYMPLIKGVSLEMYRQLIVTRDLKITIRKKAINSFFEWERLDQASGGGDVALGTKLHQQTRGKIAKRTPALVHSIEKYNRYIDTLTAQYQPEWNLPLPPKLPTRLSELRNDPNLMEDFWLLPSATEPPPPWLANESIRVGIRGLLKRTRCREERQRIGVEADTMCRWFGSQLAAVDLALRNSNNRSLITQLATYRTELLRLPHAWTTPLVSSARYAAQVAYAFEVVERIVNAPVQREYVWIQPSVTQSRTLICTGDVHEDFGPAADDPSIEPDGDGDGDERMLADIVSTDDATTDDEDEPTSTALCLLWYKPSHLRNDTKLRELFRSLQPPPESSFPLNEDAVHVPIRDRPGLFFYHSDIDLLRRPDAELNDVCVNNCAALLQTYLSGRDLLGVRTVALFLTHDYALHQQHADDATLSRNVHRRAYWRHENWFIPIHVPDARHWVACTVHTPSRRVYVFDSLGDQHLWKREIPMLWTFIKRLHHLVPGSERSEDIALKGWNAYPIIILPIQSNATDCGVWVLAFFAAYLRGFEVPDLDERHMLKMRLFLLALATSFPHS